MICKHQPYLRTSKIHNFLLVVDVIPIYILDPDDTNREKNKFVLGFDNDDDTGTNVTELSELGRPLAEKILKYWMEKINRDLTNSQASYSTFKYAITMNNLLE